MFSFFELPALVQWKILRQYVSFFTKACVLSDMPEFSDALRDPRCWLNATAEFAELLDCLRTLRPGLYLSREDWWRQGYLVSVNEDGVSFRFFETYRCFFRRRDSANDAAATTTDVALPVVLERMIKTGLSGMVEFVRKFLESYESNETNHVRFYAWDDDERDGAMTIRNNLYGFRQYFAVNCKREEIYCVDGIVRRLKKNECFLLHVPMRSYKLGVDENWNIVGMKRYSHGIRVPRPASRSSLFSNWFRYEPAALEACVKRFHVLQFDFSLHDYRYVSVKFNQKKLLFRRFDFFHDLPDYNGLWRDIIFFSPYLPLRYTRYC